MRGSLLEDQEVADGGRELVDPYLLIVVEMSLQTGIVAEIVPVTFKILVPDRVIDNRKAKNSTCRSVDNSPGNNTSTGNGKVKAISILIEIAMVMNGDDKSNSFGRLYREQSQKTVMETKR